MVYFVRDIAYAENAGEDGTSMSRSEGGLRLPEEVQTIISALEEAGFEAYAVGGCVRDAIMGRKPSDWDITTSAAPDQVKEIFRHTADTGIKHGTVTVLQGDGAYEVTTYRIDGEYEDGRHPKEVIFTSQLREDLRRRDFTINAMAYNEKAGLIDLFGGQEDLAAGLIRCVGESRERFSEDALRILRAVRFASQLDFSIEEETARAAAQMASSLSRISAERIQTELNKILLSGHPEGIHLAWELGITRAVLPVFDEMMQQPLNSGESVGEHTIHTLKEIPPQRILRWTMLLHDIGKPGTVRQSEDGKLRFPEHAQAGAESARRIMRGLKMDRETMDRVCTLIRWHSFFPEPDEATVRRAVFSIGEDLFPMYLEIKRADILAHPEPVRRKRLDWLAEIVHIYEGILLRGDPLSLRDLALTGRDLINEGFEAGPGLGDVLHALLDAVLEDPSRNTEEELMRLARTLTGRGDAGTGEAAAPQPM